MFRGSHASSAALRNFLVLCVRARARVYEYINVLHKCVHMLTHGLWVVSSSECAAEQSCMHACVCVCLCVLCMCVCLCLCVCVCVCSETGRQMWRMTSCSEICGSEYAEQTQASGNCQQYGVRSYLHQVQYRYTHTHTHVYTHKRGRWVWSLPSTNMHLQTPHLDSLLSPACLKLWALDLDLLWVFNVWNVSLISHPVLRGVHGFYLGTWWRFSDSEIA